jgi:AraC family transcriptional regulator
MQATAMSTGAAMMAESVSAVVMRLLVDADEAIDADWVAAKSCIAQATALLQAEYDGLAPAGAVGKPAAASLAGWQITRVKAYLDHHLETQIRVSTLAAICRLSTSYFSKAFKGSFGKTVQDYLHCRRVERAQAMMLSTDNMLSQIALDCGFCDQAHLSRMFQRSVGISPARWRRSQQPQTA